MSTKKNPIILNLPPKTTALLSRIAEKCNLSLSQVIEQMVEEALEEQEDIAFSNLANERDQEPLETVPDDKVW